VDGDPLDSIDPSGLAGVCGSKKIQSACSRALHWCFYHSGITLGAANDNKPTNLLMKKLNRRKYDCGRAFDFCVIGSALAESDIASGFIVFPDGAKVTFIPGRPDKYIPSPRFYDD
jgi:hypothetical protein